MKRRKRLFQPGDIVHVECLDHATTSHGHADALPVEAIGRVVRDTRRELLLTWWRDLTGQEHNDGSILLIKHPGFKARKLK